MNRNNSYLTFFAAWNANSGISDNSNKMITTMIIKIISTRDDINIKDSRYDNISKNKDDNNDDNETTTSTKK